jgi:hypothetical protein
MTKGHHLLPVDVQEITERIAYGEPLLLILQEAGVSPQDFFKHLDKVPEDKLLFEQARRVAVEMLIDDTQRIYDNIRSRGELEVARAKVGLRQWLAEKIIPATYGTKIQHDVSGTINIKAALGEANQRVLRVIENTPNEVLVLAPTLNGVNPGSEENSDPKNEINPEDLF